MNRLLNRIVASFLAFGLSVAGTCAAGAQSEGPITLSQDYWTVLTMTPDGSPDGSWGTATDLTISRAIAGAIANCRKMSGKPLGCGARYTMVQSGWSLGLHCGGDVIITADAVLRTAEQAAARRERELRQVYAPGLPPCRRVVTIDPTGKPVPPEVAARLALPAGEVARNAEQ